MKQKEEVEKELEATGAIMPLMEPPNKERMTEEEESTVTEILTSEGQAKYLSTLIDNFNLKQKRIGQAIKEVAESAKVIRDFSTLLVASGRSGSWFAIDDKRVISRDHEDAKPIPDYCWSSDK